MSRLATAPRPAAPPISAPADCRIASLLPGLTDVVHDLRLSPHLSATSHECTTLHNPPSVTSPKLPVSSSLPSHEIAAGWRAVQYTHPLFSASPSLDALLAHRVCSFYVTDIPRLAAANPTVLLTHLAKPRHFEEPDEHVLRRLLQARIPTLEKVVSVDVRTLEDVFRLHRTLAREIGREEAAVEPVAEARGRLESIRAFVKAESQRRGLGRPKTAIVQWADPLFLAGDWVPGIAALAGAGGDGFTNEGGPSVPISVKDLRGADVLLFAVCAVRLPECERIVHEFMRENRAALRGWEGRVVVTDATTLFSRPSLSAVVQSAEVVAEVILKEGSYGHKGRLWREWEAE
ncbi:unnamed protein product [Chondrus crispus]|uniref:Fe/B12 periplasmic-binding domain-containing protein n=1 Tax=Chondrus crispus TaxID=2769 RepID=R7QNQ3_CHOCR|nr:unnamed protein product [Chondrus crispus]CDF39106.1 unnamed protein product [Chondrus crispus]|eukprot:XP_005719017.1 unnamed protein product [Chondrus crispus]